MLTIKTIKTIKTKFSSSKIIKNAGLNLLTQFLSYLLTFISIPILLKFLGKESFGIFQTILTVLGWVSIANLGLGNGLRNKITENYTHLEKINNVKTLIGSAFSFSAIISMFFIFFGGICIYIFFDPELFVHNLTVSKENVKLTFIISFIFFCVNFTLSLFSSIAFGIHKSYLNTISQLIQLTFFLVLVYFFSFFLNQNQLIYTAFAFGLSNLISQFFPLIFFYKNKLIWPPIFNFNSESFKELSGISFQFLLLQIATILLFSADNFILSKFLGGNIVADYSIAYRLYFLIITLFSIILIQVWTSTTAAFAKKDFIWIDKIVKKLHVLLLGVILFLLLLSMFYNKITSFWIGEGVVIESNNFMFKLLFSIYVLIHCANAIYVNILNGLSKLKYQTFAYLIGGIIYFISCYFLIKIENLSLIGLLISKILCITITFFICYYDYKKFIKDKI